MNKDLSALMHPADDSGKSSNKRKRGSSDEEDEEGSGSGSGSDSPPPTKRVTGKQAASGGSAKKKRKGGGGGFQAEVQLSQPLAALLGTERLPRTQVVKGLWDYIKKHDLQDPKNRMRILPDARMKPVFGKDAFTGFSMMKLLKGHLS
mmetsp:Transcript_61267/g.164578  ORF Transcript_61267/g.164578 Transcript_61267/m.164578 type:complete len:148 (-) Transcript_61267:69-512(-)